MSTTADYQMSDYQSRALSALRNTGRQATPDAYRIVREDHQRTTARPYSTGVVVDILRDRPEGSGGDATPYRDVDRYYIPRSTPASGPGATYYGSASSGGIPADALDAFDA